MLPSGPMNDTCLPMIDPPRARRFDVPDSIRLVEIRSSLSTTLSCADCEIISDASTGLLGSWYFSCATSNFRNVSRSRADAAPAAADPTLGVELPVMSAVLAAAVLTAAAVLAVIGLIGAVGMRVDPVGTKGRGGCTGRGVRGQGSDEEVERREVGNPSGG